MEESFELMSSMSPKVKGRQKHFRKAATLLSLKRHIRRCSIYDKSAHTVNNEELIVTSSCTTESSETSKSEIKILNKSPIIISDSGCSDTDSEHQIISPTRADDQGQLLTLVKSSIEKENTEKNTSGKESHYPKNKSLLSKDKLNDINLWIEKVNVANEVKEDITVYSEMSTIYGDELGVNFNPEGAGHAANSTFVGSGQKRFDELFTNPKQKNLARGEEKNMNDNALLVANDVQIKNNGSVIDLIIDNSLINVESSFNVGLEKYRNSSDKHNLSDKVRIGKAKLHKKPKSTDVNEDSCENVSPLNSTRKNADYTYTPNEKQSKRHRLAQNHIQGIDDTPVHEEELITMLDDLYGDKWHEKKEHVLSRTEPRKRTAKKNGLPNSDRKPKLSVLYKNPYAETEKLKSRNLLQDLQRSRMKINQKSSWMPRVNNLCDSDSDCEQKENPRMRLNFDNLEDADCGNSKIDEKKSKYFIDNEIHVEKNVDADECDYGWDKELSYLGMSLEDRIRKKSNKIKDIPNKNKGKLQKNQTSKPTGVPLKEISDNKDIPSTKNISNSTSDCNVQNKVKLSSTSNSSLSSEDAWESEINKIAKEMKPNGGKYTFLASLSANIPILQCDMSARIYRNNFKIYKDQLLKKLFILYNESVFENAIPENTVLEWNDRMRGTAGFCYCKKITRRTGVVERTARIVLSTKVIDAAYRLRDTLIHEMCHAATWIVNCVSDGHGPYWKTWAYKAMKTFPELPPIKRCHDYAINTKYTYKCSGCGYSIGRHTKSLDIERKRCGYCLGKFEILLNKTTKNGETKSVPATPKKEATGFALFVKENYGVYKKDSQLKHGDVMKLLGKKFQEMKVNTG